MLIDGKIVPATEKISFKDSQEISEIITYLNRNHGLETIQPWFNEDLNLIDEKYLRVEKITKLLGINFIDIYHNKENYFLTLNPDENTQSIKVTGYDYFIRDTYSTTTINGIEYNFKLATTTLEYIINKNGNEFVKFSIKEFLDKYINEYQNTGKTKYTAEELSIPFENNQVKMIIYFNSINRNMSDTWFDHNVLLKIK